MSIIPDLDFPEGKGPKTYWRLVEALQRLLDNVPQSAELLALQEEAGGGGEVRSIKINQSTVALEAGRPSLRKLISGKKPTYPELAAFIRSLHSTHGLAETTTKKMERQAREIAGLKQKVRVLRSKVLAAIAAEERTRSDLKEAMDHIARLRGKTST